MRKLLPSSFQPVHQDQRNARENEIREPRATDAEDQGAKEEKAARGFPLPVTSRITLRHLAIDERTAMLRIEYSCWASGLDGSEVTTVRSCRFVFKPNPLSQLPRFASDSGHPWARRLAALPRDPRADLNLASSHLSADQHSTFRRRTPRRRRITSRSRSVPVFLAEDPRENRATRCAQTVCSRSTLSLFREARSHGKTDTVLVG